MTTVTYHVVEHDGGWAYMRDGVYSETYKSHDAARAAAVFAAQEQRLAGKNALISYEDGSGHWHEESISGKDRPITKVDG